MKNNTGVWTKSIMHASQIPCLSFIYKASVRPRTLIGMSQRAH
jgi:hypothetical protein